MADPTSPFTPFVPGFDFLQGLVKSAGEAMPSLNQWIAPTLDPEELEKKIRDLRTVQFWLEQNAKMIGATVQALEVQRMTLNTLKGMNLPMADIGASMKMRAPEPEPEPEPEPPAPPAAPKAAPAPAPAAKPARKPAADAAPGGADPMQWWGALTQQFTEIASKVIQETPAMAAAAQAPAGAPAKSGAKTAAKTAGRKAAKAPAKKAAAKRRR